MLKTHFEVKENGLSVHLDREESCITVYLENDMVIEFADEVVYYKVFIHDDTLTLKWQKQHEEDKSNLP